MTEILLGLAIVAALAGAAISFVVLSRLGSGSGGLTRDDINQLLRAETETLRQAQDLNARHLREEISGLMRALQESNAKAVEALRLVIDSKLTAAAAAQSESAAQSRVEMSDNLARLGTTLRESLRERLESFGNHQKERLDQVALVLTKQTETLEIRLEAIRSENAKKLEEMRQTVDEKLQSTLDTRLNESFTRVVEQLKQVSEGLGEMKALASNVGDLKSVLTNVKIRGTFGEVQLGMILEQFLTPDQFRTNVRVRENTTESVEFAICLPGRGQGDTVLLPIDSKFPNETYERLLAASEAGEVEAVKELRKQLLSQVRNFAKDVSTKYINPPVTTDFAILFLPTEGLYAEILRQPGAFEQLQRELKIVLAGPTTLSAILLAFQMGFRSLAIEKRSSEVWQVLGAVQQEFGKYNKVVEQLGKQLSTAANSVDSLGRRTRAMTRTLRQVEKLPSDMDAAEVLGLEDEAEAEDESVLPASSAANEA
jgi:DNA recombination protein RmuC